MTETPKKRKLGRLLIPLAIVVLLVGGVAAFLLTTPKPAMFDSNLTLTQAKSQASDTGRIVVAVVSSDY